MSKARTRREFLKDVSLSAAALGMPLCPSAQAAPEGEQPNILFIMSDDHAAQAVSCYGSRINRTPNIDRLAAEGVRFDNGFCTNSSRAVLLTGQFSHLNGVRDNENVFDGTQRTFPKLLQAARYETALFGKWHLKSDPTGFDYHNILPGQGLYYNPTFIDMGVRKQRTGYVTDLITDDCLAWLEKRNGKKPFCALLHHKGPHRNWMPNLKHLHLYEDEDIPLPETLFDDYATRSDAARQQEMTIMNHSYPAYDLKLAPLDEREDETAKEKQDRRWYNDYMNQFNEEQRTAWKAAYGPRNEAFRKASLSERDLLVWKYQRYIKDYLRCIASVDENIGRVLDYLGSAGLAQNTLVVYTSDQGFYLGEHGWYDKRFMYEESLRMPLLMRYPRAIRAGLVCKDLVQNIDFAPTFLNLAGVDVPADMQGVPLQPLFQGNSRADWRRSIYYHYYEYPGVHAVKRHYGVRTQRHKLIRFYSDIDAWEFYDLEKDPRELNNLYGHPDYAGVVETLKAELKRLRNIYGDAEGR